MQNIYKYLIIKKVGLVIQFHQNELTYNGIKKLKLDIINDKDFNPNFGFLIDIRKAKITMTAEELEDYGDFVADNLKLEELKRLAILTEHPGQVAMSMIYSLNERLKPLQYRIFSTLDGAIHWLHIDISQIGMVQSEINKITVDLKSHSPT